METLDSLIAFLQAQRAAGVPGTAPVFVNDRMALVPIYRTITSRPVCMDRAPVVELCIESPSMD